jgi:hypothetical protein
MANVTNIALTITFIISPLSVVAPLLDNRKPGLGIELSIFRRPGCLGETLRLSVPSSRMV